jgi:hypothetical protein
MMFSLLGTSWPEPGSSVSVRMFSSRKPKRCVMKSFTFFTSLQQLVG